MIKVPLPPTPGEEHEQARKSALSALVHQGKKDGLTLEEVRKLTGLVEIRAAMALQELVCIGEVVKRGRRFVPCRSVSVR